MDGCVRKGPTGTVTHTETQLAAAPYKTASSILMHHTGHNRMVPRGGRPGTQAT